MQLHARPDGVDEQLAEDETPGLIRDVEVKFVEGLSGRLARDKSPAAVRSRSHRCRERHPTGHGAHDKAGIGVERRQLLAHVKVATLQCGLGLEDAAHGLRLGQEVNCVLETFQLTGRQNDCSWSAVPLDEDPLPCAEDVVDDVVDVIALTREARPLAKRISPSAQPGKRGPARSRMPCPYRRRACPGISTVP